MNDDFRLGFLDFDAIMAGVRLLVELAGLSLDGRASIVICTIVNTRMACVWSAYQWITECQQKKETPWFVLPGLALIVLVIFASALAASFIGEDKTLQTTMCTATITLAGTAIGFFFQSSFGGQRKTELLAASTPAPTATLTTVIIPLTNQP